jgi:hypothetical protein
LGTLAKSGNVSFSKEGSGSDAGGPQITQMNEEQSWLSGSHVKDGPQLALEASSPGSHFLFLCSH